jgi:hypothetical protein
MLADKEQVKSRHGEPPSGVQRVSRVVVEVGPTMEDELSTLGLSRQGVLRQLTIADSKLRSKGK